MVQVGLLESPGHKVLTKNREEETLSDLGDPKQCVPLINVTDAETSNCILCPGPHAGSAATPPPNGTELGD